VTPPRNLDPSGPPKQPYALLTQAPLVFLQSFVEIFLCQDKLHQQARPCSCPQPYLVPTTLQNSNTTHLCSLTDVRHGPSPTRQRIPVSPFFILRKTKSPSLSHFPAMSPCSIYTGRGLPFLIVLPSNDACADFQGAHHTAHRHTQSQSPGKMKVARGIAALFERCKSQLHSVGVFFFLMGGKELNYFMYILSSGVGGSFVTCSSLVSGVLWL
jgi:hypothetical protein